MKMYCVNAEKLCDCFDCNNAGCENYEEKYD